MTNSHLFALALTLLIYLVMAVAYFGWGKTLLWALGLRDQTTRSDVTLVWLGWAFTLFLFQALHFFLPLNAYVVAPVFVVGIAMSYPDIAKAFMRQLQDKSTLARRLGILMIALAVTCWVASRSMLPPTNYDSGLYHLQTIRWLNSFPITLGLGNLHGRLAFNQSFFTWVATLNFYPWFNHGRSIANSFLLLLTIATFVYFILPVLKRPSLLIESHPFQYVSTILALPILAYLPLYSDDLISPSPDITATLLQLVLFIMFAQELARWNKGEKPKPYDSAKLTILAATAITVKLSAIVFSSIIIGICTIRVWQTHRTRGAISVILPVFVIILVLVCRGYALSGAPLYPSTIGYVSAEWSVPKEMAKEETKWILSWARQPGVHWRDVHGNWDWFQPWTRRVVRNKVGVVYPLVVSAVFGIIAMILFFIYQNARLRWFNWVLPSPMAVALVYWFFTAPDSRFANALFWCLSISSTLLLLALVQGLVKKRRFAILVCVAFIIVNLWLINSTIHKCNRIKDISYDGWHSIKTARLVQKETASGLVVFTPKQGDQCWDSPLPCTPYFNQRLRLRISGELASGFSVIAP
jgi:hypothetical protein